MLDVVVGPMRSGKSAVLVEHASTFDVAGIRYSAFKPCTNGATEPEPGEIKSRSGASIPCWCVPNAGHLAHMLLENTPVTEVIIDEIQMFDLEIIEVINWYQGCGVNFYVGGLDLSYKNQPFPVTAQLLALADNVTKIRAVCKLCKKKTATKTFLTDKDLAHGKNDNNILLEEEFLSLCPQHFFQYEENSKATEKSWKR